MALFPYTSLGVNLDLALEANEVLRGKTQQEIPGVEEEKESHPFTSVTTIKIFSPQGEKLTGKAQGTYITLESPALSQSHPEAHQEISSLLAKKLALLASLFNLGPQDTVLVIGLGNWEATPDALGPNVVSSVIVTRQLHRYAPQALPPGWRPVCSLIPGVLGSTGIETAEIVRGVVEKVRPVLVIAVDALAARNVSRIGTTIQLANTGIGPGTGVGNQRMEITARSLGVPVIALGVPTVVPAAVIAFEAMEQLNLSYPPQALAELTQKMLTPFGGALTVTPKEIDVLVARVSRVLSQGINQFLYPQATPAEISMLRD